MTYGHNSGAARLVIPAEAHRLLVRIVDQVEALERERRDINEMVNALYKEAGYAGFDVAILRTVVKLRRMDPVKRQLSRELSDGYFASLERRIPELDPEPREPVEDEELVIVHTDRLREDDFSDIA